MFGVGYTQDIKSGRFKRQHQLDESFFSVIDTEEKAYWLGFLSADGNVSGTVIRCALQAGDKEHLFKLRKSLNTTLPIKDIEREMVLPHNKTIVARQAQFDVCCARMVRDLAALGVLPAKSKTIAPWAGRSDLMRHYWRGIVDGDGCITTYVDQGYEKWAVILVGSEPMVQGFAKYAYQVCGSRMKPVFNKGCWQFQAKGTVMPQILVEDLYQSCTISLYRKQVKAEQLMNSVFKRLSRMTNTVKDIAEEQDII